MSTHFAYIDIDVVLYFCRDSNLGPFRKLISHFYHLSRILKAFDFLLYFFYSIIISSKTYGRNSQGTELGKGD